MAENKDGWFNSWLSAAKNKSTEVLEFVKKDLEEFGTAVKNEATSVVSSAGSVMEKTLSLESPDSTVNSVKRSFSSFLGEVNTVLNPSPDDSDTEAMIIAENSEIVALNKFQKALYDLQKDPETYLCDPEPHLRKQYDCWLEILDDQLSDDRIAKHVNSSEVLKKHYAKLVPDILEHQLFWKRYLFKKALLEDEIARQELVEKREQQKEREVEPIVENTNLKWEHEDFSADIELTEEQQIKILEMYEKETKQKRKVSPKKPNLETDTPQTDLNDKTIDENVKKQNINEIKEEPEVLKDERESLSEGKALKLEKEGNSDGDKKIRGNGTKRDRIEVEKKLSKVDSAVSLGTPSSSNCSTDDDWEKISDVEK